MSSRKRPVILSPQAQADLTDIRAYTLEHRGEAQRDRYETALLGRIASLAGFPESGARCMRFFPGCRARRAGSHVMYYRSLDDVGLVRILHERADPTRQFTP